jgi:OmpA-OmpF porin, OOP family
MTKLNLKTAAHTAVILIAGLSTVASPALARDNQPYVELDAGLTKLEKTNFDIGTTTAAASVEHDTGYDLGGIVGYDFGMFRLEVEASVRKADPKILTSSVRLPDGGVLSSATPGSSGSFGNAAGDARAQSLMANALIDLGKDDSVQFFVGGGVGIAKVKYKYSINTAGPGWLANSGGADNAYSKFAWQAVAGLRAPISSKVDVGVKYRFFNVGRAGLVDTAGRAVAPYNFSSHSLMASIGYNF